MVRGPWRLSLPYVTVALLALPALLIAYARPGDVIVDDAFISFRYAENLARGNGLVFNAGERVEGYSNLLWTLLLAAFESIGISIPFAAQALGAALAIGSLLLMPALARGMGASPWVGAAAATALAVTATFSSWTFRGMETSLFTFLLLAGLTALIGDRTRERPVGPRALIAFALLSITRPEGPLYVAAVAISLLGPRGSMRAAARLIAFTSLWLVQIVFRLLYYGEILPNTYYAKVWEGIDRWRQGASYLVRFTSTCGSAFTAVLVLGLIAGLLAVRRRMVRPVVLSLLAAVFFALSSGGDGMPEGRFLHPALPLLMLLAVTVARGRTAIIAAWILLPLTIMSPCGRPVRDTVASTLVPAALGDRSARLWLQDRTAIFTGTPQNNTQARVGRWLYQHVPAGSLCAVNDCGIIPYLSGLPVLDTVGLMDKHVARLPGRKHEKVDLAYVLGRKPVVIILALKALGSGLPYDTRMVSSPAFLAAYRLANVENSGAFAYFVFFRDTSAPMIVPPAGIDLIERLPSAWRTALSPEGATEAGNLVRAGYRYVLLPRAAERIKDLSALVPPPGQEVDAATLSRLDAAMHELGPLTHHGIAVSLPPGWSEAAITYEMTDPLPYGAELRLGFGLAPWLWLDGVSDAAASLSVSVSGKSGFVRAATLPVDPTRRPADRKFVPLSIAILPETRGFTVHMKVSRATPPGSRGDPFEVLIAEPEIRLPSRSRE